MLRVSYKETASVKFSFNGVRAVSVTSIKLAGVAELARRAQPRAERTTAQSKYKMA